MSAGSGCDREKGTVIWNVGNEFVVERGPGGLGEKEDMDEPIPVEKRELLRKCWNWSQIKN